MTEDLRRPVLLTGGNPQIAKADGDAPVQMFHANGNWISPCWVK